MDYKSLIAEELVNIFKDNFENEKSLDEVLKLIEKPKDLKMGDFAFPCFLLARDLKKAPPMIAKDIEALLANSSLKKNFSNIVALGPYLNFKVNKASQAADIIPKVISGEFIQARPSKNERVMVEYSQPNTHKAFHVGHTRNVALGDALVRIYEWNGFEVVASNYIGDVGAHIARCLWYFVNHFLPNESHLDFNTLEDIVSDLDVFRVNMQSYFRDHNINQAEFLGSMYSKATELMDFYSLTTTPFPGIVSAKISSIEDHPTNPKWKVLIVDAGEDAFQVVCGGKGYKLDDIVAYASIGSRVKGRLVGEIDKDGTISNGMILSPSELELSEDNENIYIIKDDVDLGIELADLNKFNDIQLEKDSVVDTIKFREKSVSSVLKELETENSSYYKLWQETKEWSMSEFYNIYDWLNVRFDNYFFESDVADSGKQLVKEYLTKGVFVKDEGAIGIRLETYNLPFFLLLKSDGTGLYSTKDLSLAELKFNKFKIDRSIYVVDVGQSLHFQQVFATLQEMGFKQAEKCFHLAYGMVVLPDGKMSSRKGNVIYFSQLKEALYNQITADFLDKYKDVWSEEEIENAAKLISIATIKYGMLNQDNNKNIVFDLSEWTAKSGNTGPYMLYAYARTRSILNDFNEKFGNLNLETINWSLLEHETEQTMISKISQFPSVMERAANANQAQQICIYLFEFSKDFSRMYSSCSVLKADNSELAAARAALVNACGLVIQKGLNLIGIETLERM